MIRFIPHFNTFHYLLFTNKQSCLQVSSQVPSFKAQVSSQVSKPKSQVKSQVQMGKSDKSHEQIKFLERIQVSKFE